MYKVLKIIFFFNIFKRSAMIYARCEHFLLFLGNNKMRLKRLARRQKNTWIVEEYRIWSIVQKIKVHHGEYAPVYSLQYKIQYEWPIFGRWQISRAVRIFKYAKCFETKYNFACRLGSLFWVSVIRVANSCFPRGADSTGLN